VLSKPGPIDVRIRALLPVRSRAELGIRALGLDRWADDHDHPLGLRESDDEVELPAPEDLPGGVEEFPPSFVKAVRTHDLIAAARRSPLAGELLGFERFRRSAADAVSRAVNWVVWLGPRRPEAVPAALTMLFLAQGYFIAVRAAAPRDEWFPSRALVRGLLEESDALEWLAEEGAGPPGLAGGLSGSGRRSRIGVASGHAADRCDLGGSSSTVACASTTRSAGGMPRGAAARVALEVACQPAADLAAADGCRISSCTVQRTLQLRAVSASRPTAIGSGSARVASSTSPPPHISMPSCATSKRASAGWRSICTR
jgi:hypothetical protein